MQMLPILDVQDLVTCSPASPRFAETFGSVAGSFCGKANDADDGKEDEGENAGEEKGEHGQDMDSSDGGEDGENIKSELESYVVSNDTGMKKTCGVRKFKVTIGRCPILKTPSVAEFKNSTTSLQHKEEFFADAVVFRPAECRAYLRLTQGRGWVCERSRQDLHRMAVGPVEPIIKSKRSLSKKAAKRVAHHGDDTDGVTKLKKEDSVRCDAKLKVLSSDDDAAAHAPLSSWPASWGSSQTGEGRCSGHSLCGQGERKKDDTVENNVEKIENQNASAAMKKRSVDNWVGKLSPAIKKAKQEPWNCVPRPRAPPQLSSCVKPVLPRARRDNMAHFRP